MKPKIQLTLLLLLCVIALGACRRSATNQNANSNAGTPQLDAPVGGSAPAGEKFFFRGTITTGTNTLRIEMALVRDGERLNGNYFYPRVGKNINLNGTVDKSGKVELKETDENGKDTGIFKGQWKPATDSPDPSLNEIEGKWSKPDGTKETPFQIFQQPIEFSGPVRVNPKVIRDANKQAHYTVEAEYPQIEGEARFDQFNREARAMIAKDVAAFKSAETATESDAGAESPAETSDSSQDIWYDFRYATDDLISVEFSESTYSRGAAHPNQITSVLNYDVKNGKKLALADLFNPKSNYLSVISAYCIKELKQKDKENEVGDMIQSGASARADNYKAWTITKKGLWIIFDPYQVGPYAAGPQYVLVPYSALKDIIKPDGPVAALAK
jgi:uncharacterized protein DUF3298/peptidoglycan-N-acetylmuramic acid deacetylase PdaC-like protein